MCVLKCKHCLKVFEKKNKLKNHIRRCTKDPAFQHVTCGECDKHFTRKSSLEEHMKQHQTSDSRSKTCMMPECHFKYLFKTLLIDHLKNVHKVAIQSKEDHDFSSWDDFNKWKEDFEGKTSSYYSKQYGEKKNKYSYYYCQHDGQAQQSKSGNTKSKRRPNTKGKIKTGNICLSMMKVKKEGNSVHVQLYPTHSHPVDKSDLKHQPLNTTTNVYVNKMICLGVSPEKIQSILKGDKFHRENRRTEVDCTRNDFIQLKSLRERKRKLLLSTNSRVLDDANSTMLLVENIKKERIDPVLMFNYGHQKSVIQTLPSIVSPLDEASSDDNLEPSILSSSSEDNNNSLSSLPSPSLNAPKPSQTNTNKLKDIYKELMERINDKRIPQILIPHVTGVLSQVLAECRSVEESTNTERMCPVVPTQKRSSTQKLTCQVPSTTLFESD